MRSSMKQGRPRFEIIDHATAGSWIRATYKVKYANTNRMHLDEPIEQCLVSRRPRPLQPQPPPPLPPPPWEPLSGTCPLRPGGEPDADTSSVTSSLEPQPFSSNWPPRPPPPPSSPPPWEQLPRVSISTDPDASLNAQVPEAPSAHLGIASACAFDINASAYAADRHASAYASDCNL